MKNNQKWLYILAGILSLICVECVIYGGFGIGIAVAAISYLICLEFDRKINQRKWTRLGKWLMLPIMLTIVCFIVFSNSILQVFNILFLGILVLLQSFEIFGKCHEEVFEMKWFFENALWSIRAPFININQSVKLIKEQSQLETGDSLKNVLKVLIGVVIAIPFIVVIVSLLASGDAAFEGTLQWMGDHRLFIPELLIEKGIVFIILYFLIFSFFYTLNHEKQQENNFIKISNLSIKPDFVIFSTIGTLLCLIYLLYGFSQLAYFVSAFKGILPAGYTFSEYARRGFFESLPITAFNLITIIILGWILHHQTGKKAVYIKGMTSLITIFALFIVSCAISKLVMYINSCGLTLWRVFATWFLLLTLGLLIISVIHIFRKKKGMLRNCFIFFSIMYLCLNYINVDVLVARQNISLYQQGKIDDIGACFELSSSAIPYICQAAEKDDTLLNVDNVNYSVVFYGESMTTDGMIQRKMEMIKSKNWQSMSLADIQAQVAYKKLTFH